MYRSYCSSDGRYSVYTAPGYPDARAVLDGFLGSGRQIEDKGRAGIRVVDGKDGPVACRKYTHGGLFRFFTGDRFSSGGRALEELDITLYLSENGFPVVRPVGVVIERSGPFTKRLYFLTVYETDGEDLISVLKRSTTKERARLMKGLAGYFRMLQTLGVYHPDLHLRNILKIPGGGLVFLDFDRAQRKEVTAQDMERMFWRLHRYAVKMSRKGEMSFSEMEMALFVREYERLSGQPILEGMAKRLGKKEGGYKLGWFFEKILYRT